MSAIFTAFTTSNVSNATSALTSQAPGVSLLFSGIESFLFPFLLIFAIVYGVLQRSEIFKGKSDIDAIIAFVLGLVFATTNYTLRLTFLKTEVRIARINRNASQNSIGLLTFGGVTRLSALSICE